MVSILGGMPAGTVRDFAHSIKALAPSVVLRDDHLLAIFLPAPWTAARGILVLKVKDWRFDTIRNADAVSFTIDTGAGHKVVASPLEQARLTFPWGYGVVLTDITRLKFEASGLGEILPPHLVICKDEMTESADAEGCMRGPEPDSSIETFN